MPSSTGPDAGRPTRRAVTAAQRARFRRRRVAVFGGALLAIAVIIVLVVSITGRRANGPDQSAADPGAVPSDPSSDSPSGARSPQAQVSPSPGSSTATSDTNVASAPAFDKKAHSIDDPTSIWVVSNKRRALQPEDYVPKDLAYPDVPNINGQPMRKQVAGAIENMFTAASDDGVSLTVQSAYRSYDTQVSVYNRYVDQLGQKGADLTSSRPGHSEHQTGLAVDVSGDPPECSLVPCFGDTVYGKWLAANGWKFGFMVRYPEDKTAITGYEYEPYHMRFVGVALATQLHDTRIETLEEFFGLPAAPDYE